MTRSGARGRSHRAADLEEGRRSRGPCPRASSRCASPTRPRIRKRKPLETPPRSSRRSCAKRTPRRKPGTSRRARPSSRSAASSPSGRLSARSCSQSHKSLCGRRAARTMSWATRSSTGLRSGPRRRAATLDWRRALYCSPGPRLMSEPRRRRGLGGWRVRSSPRRPTARPARSVPAPGRGAPRI